MIRDGMYEGNMHDCLLKTSRLAGGFLASGKLSPSDVDMLGNLAESLAIDKDEARKQWSQGVEYGKLEPISAQARYSKDEAFDWESQLTAEMCGKTTDNLEEVYLEPPKETSYNPCKELAEYIETLFQPADHVGYVTEVHERDGKYVPRQGVYVKTAEEILQDLKAGHFDDAVGTVNEEAGAWIRFNPFDGKGVKNENVTDFRYALVECDNIPVEKQVATYRSLQLPCVFIVYSGGKSAHAIVRIGAQSIEEYYARVKYLYGVCIKKGLEIDQQNKNPSRLSRMPGAKRKGNFQYIIERNTGKASFDEWKKWIEEQDDNLPEIETADKFCCDPPPLKPELVSGILRTGHKLRIAGPSKGGKSFLLLELAIAITEGAKWLGRQCRKGPVLYINLELDTDSCKNRIANLYTAMGIKPENAKDLYVWNLRGRALPMDKLTPYLIRRCHSMGLSAIIIDPIYKVLTGDENSAADMAAFCNFFDCVAKDCGCAVIDCHHHSKGAQGGKRSMDRASGSGVFARDPDALLDMIELDGGQALKSMTNDLECKSICKAVDGNANNAAWRESVGVENLSDADRLMFALERDVPEAVAAARTARVEARESVKYATAWRIEPTLREFPTFKPVNIWFNYPIHIVDEGHLADALPCDPDSQLRRQAKAVTQKHDNFTKFKEAFSKAEASGKAYTISQAMAEFNVSDRTIRRYCREADLSVLGAGEIMRKEGAA